MDLMAAIWAETVTETHILSPVQLWYKLYRYAVGRAGRLERAGRVGRVGRVGRAGSKGRVGSVGSVGPVGPGRASIVGQP
jgi:hypothetical protein